MSGSTRGPETSRFGITQGHKPQNSGENSAEKVLFLCVTINKMELT